MTKLEARRLIRRVGPYQLIDGQLYVKGKDEVMRRCALPQEVDDILYQCHDGMIGDHFALDITTRKVLQDGICCLTLFQDAFQFVKHFHVCQRAKKPINQDHMSLHPVLP